MYEFDDMAIALIVGFMLYPACQWAFSRWMARRRRLPMFRDVDDHCRDCEIR